MQSYLVIGLGGLGSETVCMLKGKVAETLGEKKECIRYLAIDSDKSSLLSLQKPVGFDSPYLDEKECISLYNPCMENVLSMGYEGAPLDMQEWLSRECGRVRLNGNGAMGKRQVGRVMGLSAISQDYLRRAIEGVLQSIEREFQGQTGLPRVLLITGTAGGTGSAILVDTAYLIREVLSRFFGIHPNQIGVDAYLYTPDVLYSLPGMGNSPSVRKALQKNAYCTFKEVDYWYNLRERGGKYSVRIGHSKRESQENAFNFCTVLSAAKGDGEYYGREYVMNAFTDCLTAMMREGRKVSAKASQNSLYATGGMYDFLHHVTWSAGLPDFLQSKRSAAFPKAAFFRYRLLSCSRLSLAKTDKKDGDTIQNLLAKREMILGNVDPVCDGFSLEAFPYIRFTMIPEGDEKLAEEISHELKTDSLLEGRGMKGIIRVTVYDYLPLYAISGFEEYYNAYRDWDPDRDWHLHLDLDPERSFQDQLLQEPFILDRAAMTDPNYRETDEYKILRGVRDVLEGAIKIGMVQHGNGKGEGKDTDPYYLYAIDPEKKIPDNIIDYFIQVFIKQKLEHVEQSPFDLIRLCGYRTEQHEIKLASVMLDYSDAAFLDGEGRERIPDVAKAIRMSPMLMEKLYNTLDGECQRVMEKLNKKMADEIMTIRYKKCLISFSNALKTGIVLIDVTKPVVYLTGPQDMILTDQRAAAYVDKRFYLYHAFSAFFSLGDEVIGQIEVEARKRILDSLFQEDSPAEGMLSPDEIKKQLESLLLKNFSNPTLDTQRIAEDILDSNEEYSVRNYILTKETDYYGILRDFYSALYRSMSD